MNQKVAGKLLDNLGCRVDVAKNGREAVKRVNTSRYDLVLMDCQMPQMDGYQATAEIRNLATATKDLPIIAMTANAMEGDRERYLAGGMDDYTTKPVQIEALQTLLERWTPGTRTGTSGENRERFDYISARRL